MKNKDKPDNIIRVDHSIRPSYPRLGEDGGASGTGKHRSC